MGLAASMGLQPGWSNLYNIYLLSDWRLVLGASFVLFLMMVLVDQLMRFVL